MRFSMIRRCLSLLIIAGLLASQLATMPHAHGAASAQEQREHDATPHFHGHWLAHADHHHGHSHTGQGHEGQSLGSGLSGADHDADAIFAPGQKLVPANPKCQIAAAGQVAALATLPDWQVGIQAGLNSSPKWHPPDEVLDASDSYLTLRNLRI